MAIAPFLAKHGLAIYVPAFEADAVDHVDQLIGTPVKELVADFGMKTRHARKLKEIIDERAAAASAGTSHATRSDPSDPSDPSTGRGEFWMWQDAISATVIEGVLSAPSAAVVVVAPHPPPPGSATKICSACQQPKVKGLGGFSGNQWNKGPGVRRCTPCIGGAVKKAKPKSSQKSVQDRNKERAARALNAYTRAKANKYPGLLASGAAKKAWAAERHRKWPLKKHGFHDYSKRIERRLEWVRTARSRAALTPRRRCTRFDRRRSPSSLAPLFFPFRRVLRRAPALCNHWRVWTASDGGTYVHRAPLLARALPSLRATSHR